MKRWCVGAILMAMAALCVAGQRKQDDGSHCLFPCPSPIVDANPAVRHEVVVKVPSRMVWRRAGGAMAFRAVGIVPAKISIGAKMATGTKCMTRSYPANEQAKADADETEFMQSMGMSGDIDGVVTCEEGQIALGKGPTVVEVILEIFETDVPPQHMWMPEGKKYRVVWRKSFTQVVP